MSSSKKLVFAFLFSILSTSLIADTTDELLSKANSALQQYEYRSALIHLKNAAQQSPKNVQLRLKMALIFVDTGQGVQAEVELDKAKRLGAKATETAVLSAKAKLLQGQFEELTANIDLLDLPQSEIARLRAIQGHAFYEQRKFPQAKRMFQRAIALSPGELEVELGQAKIYALDDNRQKEEQLILSLLTRYKHNAEVQVVAGNYYREIKDYDEALELFQKAGEIQPSNVNVWFGVVRSHIGKKNYNDAKIEIQKVLTSYPEHQVGNYLLAVIAFEQNDFNRARAAIEIVLKGEKRKFEALKLLSIIQFQQQEYSESEKNLVKYLKFHPNDGQALKTLAAVYLKRKQGVQALNILKRLEPLNDAYIYSMLATAYLHLGNKEKSEQYIAKSLQTAPEDKVIQRHFQRSRLEAGEELDIKFSDTDFNDFLSEGHIAILNLLRQKQYERAIQIIQGYMKKNPDNAFLHYLLGSTLLYKGETEKAREQFQKSIKYNPELIESRIYLAKIYQQDGKVRDAEREFREVLRIQPNNDQAMVALAGISLRAGKEDDMLKWLNKSRKTNSASLASREVLEDYYRKKGERKKALEISGEMVKIQPQNVTLLLKHANNQKAINRIDLAIETFSRIVELKPDLPSAWSGLGRLQYINNNLEKSKTSFERVLVLEPENLTAQVILIRIAMKSSRLNDAINMSKALQKQHPQSPAGFDMLGDVYIELNNPKKAIREYLKSIKVKYSSEAYIKLHSAYNLDGQVKLGFDLLQQWTRDYPEDLQLKEVLAITWQRRGEYQKARKLYEEIVETSRNNDRVLNNLALVSLELKSPMSIEYAEMAYNLNPNNNQNKDTLGWVLLKNHGQKKALGLLKEAVEAKPSNSDFRYHYAVALVENGDKNQAKNQLYLAIGSKADFSNRSEAEKLLNTLKN